MLTITSASYGSGEASVVGDDASGWEVDSLFTLGTEPEQDTASVRLGFPEANNVEMGFQDPALTPALAIAYGDDLAIVFEATGERGGDASWDVELDGGADTGPRRISVFWRDADGVAIKAWVAPIPAGGSPPADRRHAENSLGVTSGRLGTIARPYG